MCIRDSITTHRETSLEAEEKDGRWVVGAFLTPLCEHGAGDIHPLLPQAHYHLSFLNRERIEDGFTTIGVLHPAYKMPSRSQKFIVVDV